MTTVDPAPNSARRRWFGGLSLRVRLMIIGVSGVAVALAAGGVALYAGLTIAVNRTLDNEARASAADIAALIDRGTPPDPLPVSGAQVIQIIDASNRVLDGSINADRLTPLLHSDELERALTGTAVVVAGNRTGLSGPLRVSAVAARSADGRLAIVVAQQVSDVTRSISIVRIALFIGSPVLLAVLAVIAWIAIGWTLRAVETLRRGAERISGSDRAERLPVPPATDEIAALAVTLNQMLDRLAAARSRQRAFVADAAHELRSPLTSIRTQLEVAQRMGDTGDLTTDLTADLLIDVERLSALVEDLLLLARADADIRRPAHPRLFDAQSLLDNIVTSRTDLRAEVRVRPGPVVSVRADRDEIYRAVGNLVDNAVRYARSSVQLRVTSQAADIVIQVDDDGPGIAVADRERVFERFTRLDDSRGRDAGGSGLGLSIVRELVRRSGGTVALTAASGDTDSPGVSASVHLPKP